MKCKNLIKIHNNEHLTTLLYNRAIQPIATSYGLIEVPYYDIGVK